jgi:hypothetical protein
MSETLTEKELAVAKEFFAMLGGALFCACQLQLRLASLYAITFDTPGDGSLPRVEEKRQTALAESFGTAVRLAESNGSLTGDLLDEVEFAWELRDYIVHRLFLGTRSQQNEAGFPALTERLSQAMALFKFVESHIDAKCAEVMEKRLAFIGQSSDALKAHQAPWDELEDEPVEAYQNHPATQEEITRAWVMPSSVGPLLVLENAAGTFWQIADNGLAHFPEVRDASWTEETEVQKQLPALVKSRPSSRSNPPDLRASFDYDLRFDKGVLLRISRRDAHSVHYEIVVAKQGRE